jgi:hypothetical protein
MEGSAFQLKWFSRAVDFHSKSMASQTGRRRRRERHVRFSSVVDVYAASPSQLFFKRDMSYAEDFQFAEPDRSALKSGPPLPATKRHPPVDVIRSSVAQISSKLVLMIVVGHLAIAHISSLVVPVCYVSLGTDLQAMRLAVPGGGAAGLDICAVSLVLVSLTLVACFKSL